VKAHEKAVTSDEENANTTKEGKLRTIATIFFAALGPCLLAQEAGVVFTMDNAATGNNVLVFHRTNVGTLGPATSVPTHGLGTGAGLGSQGALAITDDGRWLLAVNAGSNDVSFFRVIGATIQFISKTPCSLDGGTTPISVTTKGSAAFVLNAGGTPEIQGFSVTNLGLVLTGATRKLLGSGPAQVSFSQDETMLAVTDKTTNTIETFGFNLFNGVVNGQLSQPSSGQEPFGFAFDRRGRMIVSEAFSGASGQSAVSSYRANDSNGKLTVATASLPDGQTAACWVALSKDEKYAYISNTGSNTLSILAISRKDGSLSLVNGAGATTGSKPGDSAVTVDGHFLYVLNGGDGSISGYHTNEDGTLTGISTATGIPLGAAGLVAR
jgi:6-phosphogluconolactonase (cycloisomerase 2 family)